MPLRPEISNKSVIVLRQPPARESTRAAFSQAQALQAHGKLEQAQAIYDAVVAAEPDNADAHYSRGVVLGKRKQLQAAVASYDQALRLSPGHASAHFGRGVALHELGQFDAAVASYDQAVRFKPDHAEAYASRGVSQRALKQTAAALASYEAALRCRPDYPQAYCNLGNLRVELRQLDAAVANYDQAIRLKPDFADAYGNRGIALQELGQLEAALASYDTAIRLNPAYVDAYSNRGVALTARQAMGAALASFDKAIALNPVNVEAYWGKSLTLLLNGDFDRGWTLYEWRWMREAEKLHLRHFAKPLWLGTEPLAGKTILLHSEQGLGDTLQFCRYAALVAAQGARVIAEVPRSLLGALHGLQGVSQWVAKGDPLPSFDLHCPLMSLPQAFKTRLDTIPASPAYVRSSSAKVADWSERLGAKTQPRVGLVWSGSAGHKNDHRRSMALADLLAFLPAGCAYVSLQKEVRDTDQAALQGAAGIRHFGAELADFTDTAALCELMDVVISVDTSVAHLSGALGKATWVLLPYSPDWRWLLGRDDSPWYPSMKLYRQDADAQWPPVLDKIRADLLQLAPAPPVENVPKALTEALALHEQGKLGQAQSAYEAILATQPRQADALHLLGVIAHQNKHHQRAVDLMAQAIAINANNSAFHNNRGLALKALEQREAAIASFGQAIRLNPDDVQAHYNLGNALQESRQLEAAVESYGQVIQRQPSHWLACINQGSALQGLGRLEAALLSYDQAISAQPDFAQAYENRGVVLAKLGQFDAAVASFDQAIALQPDHAEAFNNRGISLQALGRLDEAVASYDQAIGIRPNFSEVHYNRGNALTQLNQLPAAVASYDLAIRFKPDGPEVFTNRGNALKALGQLDAALASYNQAIRIKPDYAGAYCNRGNILDELGQADAALASYEKAVSLNAGSADAHTNLGLALQKRQQPMAALASFDTVLRLRPDEAEAHRNRGNVLIDLNQLDAAIASYDRAISLKPDDHDACGNKALALLLAGQFEAGWAAYEQRWLLSAFTSPLRHFTQPLWLGTEALAGKTILLHSEQGLGDTLQFCRYAALVAAQGARVIAEVPRSLLGVLQGLQGVSQWVTKGEPLPGFDLHCPLLSLPLAFKTRLDTIPASPAYLCSSSAKVADWSERLGAKTRPRVGLVWSGSTSHTKDSARSVALADLLACLPPGLDYVSLQKEVRDADQAALQGHAGIRHFGTELADFTDTAALCELMDVVTSVAHLSGALGKATWVLLPLSPDWRWLLERDDSPWYPSMKLYRQPAVNEWSAVLGKVGADLRRLAPAPRKQAGKLPGPLQQGLALHTQGRLQEAKLIYEKIIAAQPRHADALHLLGVIAHQGKDDLRAVHLIGKAIAINPKHSAFYSNQGIALEALGQAEAAVVSYDQAIRLKPDYAEAHNNRGNALKVLLRLSDALASYDTAIRLQPGYADAHANRGNLLVRLGRHHHAVASYDQAIRLKPDYVAAHINRGVAFKELQQIDSAVASYDQAIRLDPGNAEAHWNKSLALLLSGDFDAGWPLYEWRWQREAEKLPPRHFKQPLWRGTEPLAGKTILLHSEQGLGDTLQFCRYAALVAAQGARVIAEVPRSLLGVLQGLQGVSQWVTQGEPLPAFDLHCPLLSLPLAFKTRLDTVPAGPAYLRSSLAKVAHWADRLGTKTRPRVGLAWSGSAGHKNDHKRSIALQSLLASLPPGLDYVSLQKEVRDTDQAALQGAAGIRHFGDELADFTDTAALCKLMDVVISVDTSVAHLSGALGKPTWVLLPYSPDWRWLLGRSDSPWYPSMTLYRQAADSQWTPVLGRIQADLLAQTF